MKTSNLLFFIAILLHLPLPLMSQRQAGWPGDFFRGYEKSVRGGGFQYHSPQPDVNSSLLVRSLDSTQYIEWESQVVPHVRTIEASCFIWLFGIDANNDSHAFRLFVNGKYCLAFSNPLVSELKPWIVTGESGASITFRTTMLDKYSDPMGYAILTLPDSLVVRGRPQRFKVIGETAGSRSWYMTFETAIREQLDISQEESVIRHQDKNSYSLLFDFVHLGNMVKGTIEIQGIQAKTFLLQPGFNSIRVLYPETLAETEISVLIKKEGYAPEEKKVVIKPPRRRTIYLVQHTHTDIGYTRPQTEILPEHLRYIDDALDFCDQTDTLPEAAQFRWTCETSWAVREYLKTRPQDQVERLKRRVKEGRIELTGLFLNSSDLGDEPVIAATLQPVKYFRDKGFPVRAAMQSDIN
ncbi:MAG: hypothetical protein WCI71_16605, partial [Bacteroidota bacterium]